MPSTEHIAFFGWGTVRNIAFLMVSFQAVTFMRKTAVQLHGHFFRLNEEDHLWAFFQYLAQYKIVVLVFLVVSGFQITDQIR